jgi:hypothetical protein
VDRVHKGIKPFPCSDCQGRFITEAALNRHVALVHMSDKHFACEECSTAFKVTFEIYFLKVVFDLHVKRIVML